ncbi:MAG: thioredoxin-dependent thiol peroxidase [Cyclobacteriaceae bacterium]|nr:thioredoxin-dependent thiol peroxidase [Cyclobacteriaceae bacterium]
MALTVGTKAPDFKSKDQDGNEVSLASLKGKKFVLYFYPKDMTPGCTAEACNLRDNYSSLKKAGYEIFGISSDDEKSHKKFIAKEKLPFRLLADTDKTVHQKFGTWVEKSMYGRKYMGTARVTYVIDGNGVIENVIDKVDTKDHAAQILGKPSSATKAVAPSSKKTPVKKAKKTPAKKKAVKKKK